MKRRSKSEGGALKGPTSNYDGNLAVSWQTLWVRPVFGRCHHGQHGPAKGSGRQRGAWAGCQRLAAVHAGGQLRSFWQDVPSYLYADSASIAGKYLESIDAHFTRWSVSYNKWTGPLEAGAARLPDASWSAREEEAWRDGTAEEAGGNSGGWWTGEPLCLLALARIFVPSNARVTAPTRNTRRRAALSST